MSRPSPRSGPGRLVRRTGCRRPARVCRLGGAGSKRIRRPGSSRCPGARQAAEPRPDRLRARRSRGSGSPATRPAGVPGRLSSIPLLGETLPGSRSSGSTAPLVASTTLTAGPVLPCLRPHRTSPCRSSSACGRRAAGLDRDRRERWPAVVSRPPGSAQAHSSHRPAATSMHAQRASGGSSCPTGRRRPRGRSPRGMPRRERRLPALVVPTERTGTRKWPARTDPRAREAVPHGMRAPAGGRGSSRDTAATACSAGRPARPCAACVGGCGGRPQREGRCHRELRGLIARLEAVLRGGGRAAGRAARPTASSTWTTACRAGCGACA
jgi:hypothetical protein